MKKNHCMIEIMLINIKKYDAHDKIKANNLIFPTIFMNENMFCNDTKVNE